MKERPILFSAPMVRAILSGQKMQTRRTVKPQPEHPHFATRHMLATDDEGADLYLHSATLAKAIRCPYGQPGDRLYVLEAWRTLDELDPYSGGRLAEMCLDAGYRMPWAPIQYEADKERRNWQNVGTPPKTEPPKPGRYRHARFMPRWVSRILLEVVSVRVERLNAISEADAIAEGIACENVIVDTYYANGHHEVWADRCFFDGGCEEGYESAADAYAELWNNINGPDAWASNPWVWVVEFKRVQA